MHGLHEVQRSAHRFTCVGGLVAESDLRRRRGSVLHCWRGATIHRQTHLCGTCATNQSPLLAAAELAQLTQLPRPLPRAGRGPAQALKFTSAPQVTPYFRGPLACHQNRELWSQLFTHPPMNAPWCPKSTPHRNCKSAHHRRQPTQTRVLLRSGMLRLAAPRRTHVGMTTRQSNDHLLDTTL